MWLPKASVVEGRTVLTAEKRSVSVVLACCGEGLWPQIRAATEFWRAQSIGNVEVIISEQAIPGASNYSQLAAELGCSYVCSYPERGPQGERYFSRGRACNAGFLVSSGAWIYFTGPEVYPFGTDFLDRNVQHAAETGALCLTDPAVINLVGGHAARRGFLTSTAASTSTERIRNSRHVLIGEEVLDPIAAAGHKVPGDGKRVICCQSQLCLPQAFLDVAGYCEDYLVSGYETRDIKWKHQRFAAVGSLCGNLCYIAHAHPYCNIIAAERNRFLYLRRKVGGVDVAIAEDRASKASLLAAVLRREPDRASTFLVTADEQV